MKPVLLVLTVLLVISCTAESNPCGDASLEPKNLSDAIELISSQDFHQVQAKRLGKDEYVNRNHKIVASCIAKWQSASRTKFWENANWLENNTEVDIVEFVLNASWININEPHDGSAVEREPIPGPKSMVCPTDSNRKIQVVFVSTIRDIEEDDKWLFFGQCVGSDDAWVTNVTGKWRVPSAEESAAFERFRNRD